MTEIAIDKHGWKILELLGIDTKNAVEAVIKIRVNDLLTVEVTHLVKIDNEFVLNEDETDIEKVLKRYELKERKKSIIKIDGESILQATQKISNETKKVGNDK